MKKIIFLLLIVLSSCVTLEKTINVYQKYYPGTKETESVSDLFSQVKEQEVDSVSLDRWLTLQGNNDDGYILQKSISSTKQGNLWRFIYTKHVVLDTSFYSIKVFVSTKDKNLQKLYGR